MASNGNAYIESFETKAWNNAKNYAELKIMKFLILADDYETLATFGVNELMQEFQASKQERDLIKLRALYWLNSTLLTLVSNTTKLVKTKYRQEMKNYKLYLYKLKEVIEIFDEDSKIKKRDGKIVYQIDEYKFSLILRLLSEIKENINDPLNKSELIYTSADDYDPVKIKEEIMNNLIDVA